MATTVISSSCMCGSTAALPAQVSSDGIAAFRLPSSSSSRPAPSASLIIARKPASTSSCFSLASKLSSDRGFRLLDDRTNLSRRMHSFRTSASAVEAQEADEGAAAEPEETAEESAIDSPAAALLDPLVTSIKSGSVEDEVLASVITSVDAEIARLQQLADEAVEKLAAAEVKSKESLLRLNADFDNFRKRTAKEKEDLRIVVKGDVLKELLPMMDNFQLAKNSVKTETEKEEKIANSYQNIYNQVLNIMSGLGVTQVPTTGEPFDPEVHDAIMREPTDAHPEDSVIEEFRAGYVNNGRLLRPAMVKVATAPEGGPAEAPVDESTGDNSEVAAGAEQQS